MELTQKVKDFKKYYKTYSELDQKIRSMVEEAMSAIKMFHGYKPYNISLEEVIFDGNDVTLACEEFNYNEANEKSSFTMPLSIALSSEGTVINYFSDLKKKEDEERRRQGERIAEQEKEKRKQLYDKLRLEFDGENVKDVVKI